jgi:hypothetical protein
MIELLLTSIYIGLKNDFYTQLTGNFTPSQFLIRGPSLSDLTVLPQTKYALVPESTFPDPVTSDSTLKRKKNKPHRLPRKKQKRSHPESQDSQPKPPNAIIFARSRLFYARPSRSLRGAVIFGLRKERTPLSRPPSPQLS